MYKNDLALFDQQFADTHKTKANPLSHKFVGQHNSYCISYRKQESSSEWRKKAEEVYIYIYI